MKPTPTLIILFLLNLTGCTHNQSKILNVNTSSVNTYPPSMSNLQLCDTETNKLYFTKTVDWFAGQIEHKEDSEEEASAVVLPAN
ncbi:hypothetical protein AB6C99_21580 [Vibrio cyclitrophicus]